MRGPTVHAVMSCYGLQMCPGMHCTQRLKPPTGYTDAHALVLMASRDDSVGCVALLEPFRLSLTARSKD